MSGAAEFGECLSIRIEVFVLEQGVPEEEELDDFDATAIHVLARLAGRPVGTGRLVIVADRGRIGRMAVREEHRSLGVGSAIMARLLTMARERRLSEVYLAAQLQAIPFYERFGFMAEGDLHMDGGIAHRWMSLRLPEGEQ